MPITESNMQGQYTSDERLYLDKGGNVVKDGDPNADSLLVGEGGTLSAEDVEKYGLKVSKAKAAKTEVEAEPEAPAKAATPAVPAKPAAKKK